MNEPQIVCPKCDTPIKLTDSLAAPLVVKLRKQFEQRLAQKDVDFAKREATLRKSQRALAKARNEVDKEIARRLDMERVSISRSENQRARAALASDLEKRDKLLQELQDNLDVNNAKLAEAQRAHTEVLHKSRELDNEKRELDLSVQRKVQESLDAVRDQAIAEVEDNLKLKIVEREAQIGAMQRQIEELSRRADQGSQQLQGEALELELESFLRDRFPYDLFEPVPKGVFGGDIVQRVRGAAGELLGTILWECKRTKTWNNAWLSKLRDDQRIAKAEIALLVSAALPKSVETFDFIDSIWVTKLRFAVPLAIALRQSLIDLASSHRAAQGQQTKREMIYEYLTGPRFRNRIEAIIEKFTDMQADLTRERKTMMRIWAKREEQLKGVLDSSSGLYGDLQGIAGQAVVEIEALDSLMIEDRSH